MSDREVKEFTTPKGLKIILKTYLTAREFTPIVDGKDTLKFSEKNNMLIEAGIVSINGSTENVLQQVLDLPVTEYTAITKELGTLIMDLIETK
jgi:hypothetical protein